MTIFLGSRYQDQGLHSVADTNTPVRQFVLRMESTTDDPGLKTHVWAEGDRIDRVAAERLGSASLWWRIMDVNPDILDPAQIPLGSVVRIPNADQ